MKTSASVSPGRSLLAKRDVRVRGSLGLVLLLYVGKYLPTLLTGLADDSPMIRRRSEGLADDSPMIRRRSLRLADDSPMIRR